MDKERLFEIFQANYMSGRDVMNRLPLNIDAESFWTELIDRRKGNSVMVPLYGLKSHPYWYVLTDKIIQASEILCGASLSWNEKEISMTKQMTEEMYFTSFVEGARISFSDGVDFLLGNREPECIEEQMLMNNRSAWVSMVGHIYQPLDKRGVLDLSGTLMKGMDAAYEGYRTFDSHKIAVMGAEQYRVPEARFLPDRMEELYSFLDNSHYHPLIKAAASQAFILSTRPFPEGNERLGRMVSAAVLYQNGYGYFKDVSLSKVIAAELPMYYNAMKETIREVNGGDLTYFIEYYLGMLVRALKRLMPSGVDKGSISEKQDDKPILEDKDTIDREGLAGRDGSNAEGNTPGTGNIQEEKERVGQDLNTEKGPSEEDTHDPPTDSTNNINSAFLEELLEVLSGDGEFEFEIRASGLGKMQRIHKLHPGSAIRTVLSIMIKAKMEQGDEPIKISEMADRIGITNEILSKGRYSLQKFGLIKCVGWANYGGLYTLNINLSSSYIERRQQERFVLFLKDIDAYVNPAMACDIRYIETRKKNLDRLIQLYEYYGIQEFSARNMYELLKIDTSGTHYADTICRYGWVLKKMRGKRVVYVIEESVARAIEEGRLSDILNMDGVEEVAI